MYEYPPLCFFFNKTVLMIFWRTNKSKVRSMLLLKPMLPASNNHHLIVTGFISILSTLPNPKIKQFSSENYNMEIPLFI